MESKAGAGKLRQILAEASTTQAGPTAELTETEPDTRDIEQLLLDLGEPVETKPSKGKKKQKQSVAAAAAEEPKPGKSKKSKGGSLRSAAELAPQSSSKANASAKKKCNP